MAFPPQFLDEIRARVPLADVIGRRVRLQKRGKEYLGLCPFHNEKTPSFTVNEDKGFYHCFGCGAHGDVIGFVMQTEGRSFPEAVEDLAARAGLDVPKASPEERAKAKAAESLHAVNEAACAWFEARLRGAEGRAALDYLEGRGLTDDTIARFRLGFAPDGRENLKRHLLEQGVSEELSVEAGLLGTPEDGRATYDRFRNRVIFPISDRRGRVIAFGGRIMGDGQPKYLNSSDTPIFHKGRVLYGHARAAGPVRQGAPLIVTEGYMDVIALHQAGFEGAVAPLGTAMTESHIEMAWRLTDEPVLCFDGDDAGLRAAARAADRALPILAPGKSLRFAILPRGEDPDSLVRSQGAAAFERVLAAALPMVDMLWQVETRGRALDTPERRAGLRKDLLARASRIAERSVQDYYRAEFDRRLDKLYGRGREWGGERRRGRGWRPVEEGAGLRSTGNVDVLELRHRQALLAAAINHPELLDAFGEELGAFDLPPGELDTLRQELLKCEALGLDSDKLSSHLKAIGFSAVLDRLMTRDVYELAPFAAPWASLDEAMRGWRHLYGIFRRRRHLDRELETAQRAMAEDFSERNWAYLSALRRELNSEEDASDDWGESG